MSERIGLYPGTFDPITLGHLDVIKRASKLVDRLVVAIADNDGKGPLFGIADRIAMAEVDIAGLRDSGELLCEVEVVAFSNLLMDFAEERGASVVIRGLRAVSDFEYEFQMAGMNLRLNPRVETMFLMASDVYQLISSRFVKEIARMGGDVTHFVTPAVAKKLTAEFAAAA